MERGLKSIKAGASVLPVPRGQLLNAPLGPVAPRGTRAFSFALALRGAVRPSEESSVPPTADDQGGVCGMTAIRGGGPRRAWIPPGVPLVTRL